VSCAHLGQSDKPRYTKYKPLLLKLFAKRIDMLRKADSQFARDALPRRRIALHVVRTLAYGLQYSILTDTSPILHFHPILLFMCSYPSIGSGNGPFGCVILRTSAVHVDTPHTAVVSVFLAKTSGLLDMKQAVPQCRALLTSGKVYSARMDCCDDIFVELIEIGLMMRRQARQEQPTGSILQ
jgi:hypothetical protein